MVPATAPNKRLGIHSVVTTVEHGVGVQLRPGLATLAKIGIAQIVPAIMNPIHNATLRISQGESRRRQPFI